MTQHTGLAAQWADEVAQQWDGCMFDAGPSGEIDIGAAIREAFDKRLTIFTAAQLRAYASEAVAAAIAAPAVADAEMMRDARRYRALRHSLSNEKCSTSWKMPRVIDPINAAITYLPNGFDRAIDDAMALIDAAKKEGGAV